MVTAMNRRTLAPLVLGLLVTRLWAQSTSPAAPPANQEKPAPPAADVVATKDNPLVNSLGMKFVSVPAAGALFCVWETRVKDFEVFVSATRREMGRSMWVSGRDGWKDRAGYDWRKPGFPQTPNHPVVGVSWKDAAAFCEWLTNKERSEGRIKANHSYRLPTDQEWSAAVGLIEPPGGLPKDKSGSVKDQYPWGRSWPPPKGAGNYAGSEARNGDWKPDWGTIDGYSDDFPRTAPVGSFAGNDLGLFDLGGNVWEWCEDRFDSKHDWRVLRGGSWHNYVPTFLLTCCRVNDPPDKRSDNNGFRVVLAEGQAATR
jgi:formylglycine-generating enzyme required for sulfatase activity